MKDKWDEVQARHWQERTILEEMEEDYYAQKRSFEQRHNRLDEYRQLLQNSIEDNYELTLAIIQKNKENPNFEEAHNNLIDIITQATEDNQTQFVHFREKLDIEEEEFEQNYRKAYTKQEEKVEALHWELVKIDQAEKEEKGRRY